MAMTKQKIQDKRGDSIILAGAMLETLPKIVKDNKHNLFIYSEPLYKPIGNEEIEEIIFKFLKVNGITQKWKNALIAEIYKAIRASVKTIQFNNYSSLICFSNKILNIETLETKKFSDEYYFTTFVDVEYNPEVKEAPAFSRFLASTFTLNNGSPDVETIKIIMLISGYLIYPKNTCEQMFFFIGDGANGKSVLIELYKMFFPREFITSLSLDILAKESSFKREGLITSRLNVASEAKGKEIDSEEIKKIVSGESINVDRKNRPAMEILPQTKILIATNSMPFFADTSHGIDRRLLIIDFKNRFVKDEKQLDNDSRIFKMINKPDLLSNLRKEKSAILNAFIKSLIGLKRLKWVIPESTNTKEIKESYIEQTDTLGYWIRDTFIKGKEGDAISVQAIYDAYKTYYEQNVSKNLNLKSTTVSKRIKEIFRVEPFGKRSEQYGGKLIRHYCLKMK